MPRFGYFGLDGSRDDAFLRNEATDFRKRREGLAEHEALRRRIRNARTSFANPLTVRP